MKSTLDEMRQFVFSKKFKNKEKIMKTITYLMLTRENFRTESLDNFKRYQKIQECWRKINNMLVLVPYEFIEDWDLSKRRNVAEAILKIIDCKNIVYGAYFKDEVVGFIYLSDKFFGRDNQYIELSMFQVSELFRKMGIGKSLFKFACEDARHLGVSKLYISAHSSKESQAAYRKIGCIEAVEINKAIAEDEPFDIQMEYQL